MEIYKNDFFSPCFGALWNSLWMESGKENPNWNEHSKGGSWPVFRMRSTLVLNRSPSPAPIWRSSLTACSLAAAWGKRCLELGRDLLRPPKTVRPHLPSESAAGTVLTCIGHVAAGCIYGPLNLAFPSTMKLLFLELSK